MDNALKSSEINLLFFMQNRLPTNQNLPQIDHMTGFGLSLHQEGRFQGAQQIYQQVLKNQPKNFMALQLLGTLFTQINQPLQAIYFLNKAIKVNPKFAPCFSNLGNALQEVGRLEEALVNYDKAIRIQPDYAEAFSNRANTLQKLGRLEEALASFDRAISLNSNYIDAFINRGNILKELKRFDESIMSFDNAIRLNSDSADAYYNLGVTFHAIKCFDEALDNFNLAIQKNPEYADAHWNKSLLLLSQGFFEEGWQEYEWGWKASQRGQIRTFLQPLWLGEQSLRDKIILLYSEQGLGDAIQFCRYISLVAQHGARIILEVQAPLIELFSNLEDVTQIIAQGDSLPEFDYQCPLMSLPLAFRTVLETIPKYSPRITKHLSKVDSWKEKLGERQRPRIGLVWSGSLAHSNDANRSLTLFQLLPYLSPQYEYICLQKELRDIDKDTLKDNPQIRFFGGELKDFLDTSALCELMDLVICVDTSVTHLAASLGKKTWVLLPFSADWRWLISENVSPWYPSVALYRQDELGDWSGVLGKMQKELACLTFVSD